MKGKIGNLESSLENNNKEWRELEKRVKLVEDNDQEKNLKNDQPVH